MSVGTRQQWWRDGAGWNTRCDSNPDDADKTIYLWRLGERIIEPLYAGKEIESNKKLIVEIDK
ncbi:MAG: hypothetical protein HY934_07865 [Candidatus Firestonebacteria bacterium]|nr:hypothetical protein [Candidatus Firestonebacteria bacterium]